MTSRTVPTDRQRIAVADHPADDGRASTVEAHALARIVTRQLIRDTFPPHDVRQRSSDPGSDRAAPPIPSPSAARTCALSAADVRVQGCHSWRRVRVTAPGIWIASSPRLRCGNSGAPGIGQGDHRRRGRAVVGDGHRLGDAAAGVAGSGEPTICADRSAAGVKSSYGDQRRIGVV